MERRVARPLPPASSGLRFLAGALTGAAGLALVVLHIFAGYEDVLFDRIVAAKVESGWTDEKKVAVLTNAAHELVKYRAEIFTNLPPSGLRERWLRSAEVDLMTGRGACGSFTSVLARLLDRAGIGYRVAQMYCEASGWGCHIILEANVGGRWVTADALYDVVFPAGAKDVGERWDEFRALTPPDYEQSYRYADIRYTNWTKVPVLMPAVKSVLDRFAPEFSRTLSIRSYVLNVYRTYEIALTLLVAGAGLAALGVSWRRRPKALAQKRPAELHHGA